MTMAGGAAIILIVLALCGWATLCAGQRSPKQRLDALPALKAASEQLDSYIQNIEGLRLVA